MKLVGFSLALCGFCFGQDSHHGAATKQVSKVQESVNVSFDLAPQECGFATNSPSVTC